MIALMGIEICTVGGFHEFGRNMTAIKVDDQVILLDMGVHMEKYIQIEEDEDVDMRTITADELSYNGAIPNLDTIADWKNKVVAIVPTHAHLDHIGAIPYLVDRFEHVPFICTPFTAKVIQAICREKDKSIQPIIQEMNSTYSLPNIDIEFISITHSTVHTAVICIHTPYGRVVYATDWKFDEKQKLAHTNTKRLAELENVKCLILDSTRAQFEGFTPSEDEVYQRLKDILYELKEDGNKIIITTFSSHIERLANITALASSIDRDVVFLGRSLAKYVYASKDAKVFDFEDYAEIIKFPDKIKRRLKQIDREGAHNYLFVVTGHQGEQRAVLNRIINGQFDMKLEEGDAVIYSCNVIPTESSKINRKLQEGYLHKKGVKVFKDIHASGHPSRGDLVQMLNYLKPQHIIPCHGEIQMIDALADLCKEAGFSPEKVHIMKNSDRIQID